MDPKLKLPNILRLPGISLSDYKPIEDVADEKLLGQTASDDPEAPASEDLLPPDKIPRIFTGLEHWPLRTNLRCWVCDFTFDGSPKFVATHVREGENGGIEFGVLGNMCSFNCAERWIITSIGARAGSDERWRYQDNLRLAYLMFTGHHVARIEPAPPKTELKKYGGEWDEEVFWARMRELDPLHGLRDHTPGTVIPERERSETALAIMRYRSHVAPAVVPREISVTRTGTTTEGRSPSGLAPGSPVAAGADSVWVVCGLGETQKDGEQPAGETKSRFDAVDIDEILATNGEPPKPVTSTTVAKKVANGVKTSKTPAKTVAPSAPKAQTKAISTSSAAVASIKLSAKTLAGAATSAATTATKPTVKATPASATKPASVTKPPASVKVVKAATKKTSSPSVTAHSAAVESLLTELGL